ncbi:O-methyltransferase [Amantichitinum ursilacus]|uniref:O-methyltransferase n=1 Tax=Amantichitinum ursilacus TaxID=857265 RepID=A0A0N1JTL4_9NEIS|nr:class I SAM-dependent methyltransferase [Amantichitinum ursilacus]KPC54588.1 O-methyltransferase [Amantichitinum ursilacus]
MNTLLSAPVAPLLKKLYDQADASGMAMNFAIAELSDELLTRLMRSKTEYTDFYTRLKEVPLAVSRETGQLLYMLARHSRAQTIVEFGTSFGISTLHLAAALRDNGGGKLITTEFEPSKVAQAQANINAASLADLVEIRAGDALQTLAVNLPDRIDVLLLDGAKALYPEVLALLEQRLRPGALVIADDADYSPDYLAHVRNRAAGYLSMLLGDDVELSIRLA